MSTIPLWTRRQDKKMLHLANLLFLSPLPIEIPRYSMRSVEKKIPRYSMRRVEKIRFFIPGINRVFGEGN